MLLIGFAGPMGVGKDTYGNAIKEEMALRGYETVHCILSEPLREELNRLIQLFKDSLDDSKISTVMDIPIEQIPILRELHDAAYRVDKEYTAYSRTPELRSFIQYYGTDFRRGQNPNYWINKLGEYIAKHKNKNAFFYITDIRQPNEAEFVKSLSGVVVRLFAEKEVRVARLLSRDGKEPTKENLENHTETAHLKYKEYDFVIDTGVSDVLEETKKLANYMERRNGKKKR